VLCHADRHGWTVLVRGDDEVAIVDWDEPLLAPKERDLMFVGAASDASGATPEECRTSAQVISSAGHGQAACAALTGPAARLCREDSIAAGPPDTGTVLKGPAPARLSSGSG
jgi:hypothetical protein